MKKSKTVFVCNKCGNESGKWMGQCPSCGAWNSFYEEKLQETPPDDTRRRAPRAMQTLSEAGAEVAKGNNFTHKPIPIGKVSSYESSRIDTGIGELNRVLGGGLVKGSLVLISGEPGIGKSTIIIQAASNISRMGGSVLYVSGEESEEQIKMRADRVCGQLSDNLYLLSETSMENITEAAAAMAKELKLLIIDSIQTMFTEELDSAPGSVSQVRGCGNLLMNIGKSLAVPVIIVAHVTKSGELAGPRTVEHMVDAVLSFTGERTSDLRLLRAVKNRFGTTAEVGAFEMREEGLVQVENLSGAFLDSFGEGSKEGCCASAVNEGTRPVLMEIQALTSPANAAFAMRRSVGIDSNRLSMLIAVLERKAGVHLFNKDVYLNVAGGFRPEGTATDLAAVLAIISAEKGITLPCSFMAIGEIGLSGDIRYVQHAEKLVKEAARMGFKYCMLPSRSYFKLKNAVSGIRLIPSANIREALCKIQKLETL